MTPSVVKTTAPTAQAIREVTGFSDPVSLFHLSRACAEAIAPPRQAEPKAIIPKPTNNNATGGRPEGPHNSGGKKLVAERARAGHNVASMFRTGSISASLRTFIRLEWREAPPSTPPSSASLSTLIASRTRALVRHRLQSSCLSQPPQCGTGHQAHSRDTIPNQSRGHSAMK